jgi:hypothetical protein
MVWVTTNASSGLLPRSRFGTAASPTGSNDRTLERGTPARARTISPWAPSSMAHLSLRLQQAPERSGAKSSLANWPCRPPAGEPATPESRRGPGIGSAGPARRHRSAWPSRPPRSRKRHQRRLNRLGRKRLGPSFRGYVHRNARTGRMQGRWRRCVDNSRLHRFWGKKYAAQRQRRGGRTILQDFQEQQGVSFPIHGSTPQFGYNLGQGTPVSACAGTIPAG